MIQWIKWEEDNPPELNKYYLVFDGENVDILWLHFNEITGKNKFDLDAVGLEFEPTHYAHINLPEGE